VVPREQRKQKIKVKITDSIGSILFLSASSLTPPSTDLCRIYPLALQSSAINDSEETEKYNNAEVKYMYEACFNSFFTAFKLAAAVKPCLLF
jgi:hypothetical protein